MGDGAGVPARLDAQEGLRRRFRRAGRAEVRHDNQQHGEQRRGGAAPNEAAQDYAAQDYAAQNQLDNSNPPAACSDTATLCAKLSRRAALLPARVRTSSGVTAAPAGAEAGGRLRLLAPWTSATGA